MREKWQERKRETQVGQPQDETGPSLWSVCGGGSLSTTEIPLSAGFSL